MKEIFGNTKIKRNSRPRNLSISNTEITESLLIIINFNDFFVNTGPKLTSVIPNSTKTFQTFLPEINMVLNGTELTEIQFLYEFQSLKNDKSPDFGELHVNVIKYAYNEIKAPLMHVFTNSIDNGSFLEKRKIVKVIRIIKAGKKELEMNYRLISVLLCLSKLLEWIMYSRLYSENRKTVWIRATI